jgi:hypothetical protein
VYFPTVDQVFVSVSKKLTPITEEEERGEPEVEEEGNRSQPPITTRIFPKEVEECPKIEHSL